ncbi:MAG: DnaB-like helicase C-terminal domain-containing protein [Bacteroidales bacterium]|nr:DnaB-like helicase C-terminal domain-containing protein [Bacteroidales bacterium]
MKLNKLLYHIGEKVNCIPTGIASLDAAIGGGLLIGNISVMASRPAMGKTSFAMTVVRNIGIINKTPMAVISLEDDSEYIAKRLLATEYGWNAVSRIMKEQVNLTAEQSERIAMLERIGFHRECISNSDFIEKIKEAPVWIEHNLCVNMEEIVSKIERLKHENDIQLVVIDNFGNIAMDGYASDKELAIQKLLHTAERLKIAILVTARVLRSVESRGGNKKPMLYDMENMSSLENYASLIMFLYRPEYYQIYEDEYGSTIRMADVVIARNRRGNSGEVRLEFVNSARFDSLQTVAMPSFYPFENNRSVFPSMMNEADCMF